MKRLIIILSLIFLVGCRDPEELFRLRDEVEQKDQKILELEEEIERLNGRIESLVEQADELIEANKSPEEKAMEEQQKKIEDDKAKIENSAGKNQANYQDFEITSKRVNENYGTDEPYDYILLIDVTWSKMNTPSIADPVLKMYSDDITALLAKDGFENISEVAIFIKDEYNNRDVKYHYTYRDGGFYLDETM